MEVCWSTILNFSCYEIYSDRICMDGAHFDPKYRDSHVMSHFQLFVHRSDLFFVRDPRTSHLLSGQLSCGRP